MNTESVMNSSFLLAHTDLTPSTGNGPPVSTLCELCQNITFPAMDTKTGYLHHASGADLRQEITKTNACTLCSLIWWSLRSFHVSILGSEDNPVRLLLNPPGSRASRKSKIEVVVTKSEHLRTKRWTSRMGETWLSIAALSRPKVPHGTLDVSAVLGSGSANQCKFNYPEDYRGSKASFALINNWVDRCSMNHKCMPTNRDCTLLPKRVIDVGSIDGSMEPRLCLEGSQNHPVIGKYVALSYCWGTAPFLATTSSSIPSHTIAIPIAQMPQTIQDAVIITRNLGIQYLWVDAFCILQGDDEYARSDWMSESVKMASVYQNAFLTISAASAASSHEGILQRKAIPNFQSSFLRFPRSPAPDSAREAQGTFRIGPRPPDMSDEPLDSRAWAYQEHLLSHRILGYGSWEMFWSCHCEKWSERCRESENICTSQEERVSVEDTYLTRISADWRDVVEKYSSRKLTQASDRLPALAGLAAAFENMHGGSYVAGIWHNNLAEQLLWHRLLGAEERISAPNKTRFTCPTPTWTWAAVEGKVAFHRPSDLWGTFNVFESINVDEELSLHIYSIVKRQASIHGCSHSNDHGRHDYGKIPPKILSPKMETFIDDPESLVYHSTEPDPTDSTKLLLDTWFVWINYSSGLILLPCDSQGPESKLLKEDNLKRKTVQTERFLDVSGKPDTEKTGVNGFQKYKEKLKQIGLFKMISPSMDDEFQVMKDIKAFSVCGKKFKRIGMFTNYICWTGENGFLDAVQIL